MRPEHNHPENNGRDVEDCPGCDWQEIWDEGWEAGHAAAMKATNQFSTGYAMAMWENSLGEDNDSTVL
jgi:hypothetical protein